MPSARTEQRKLAAIMFTDMVDYSALAQRDEAFALELLEEHRGLLRSLFPRFNGHEVKTIGDAFLVEFHSALEAAQCAIEIQRTLAERNQHVVASRRIQVRIGVHIGDVMHRDGDVLGDGVNIASRLEPLAGPSGICFSEDAARQVQDKIPLRLVPLGKVTLKNIERPMEVFTIPCAEEPAPLSTSPAVTEQKSIAVLPFVNMSSDRENEYLSDGITEDLITALSKLPGLRVPARTSSFAFKGKNEDIRKIGHLLNVTIVLEGSVRKAGNKLRITAQLINVADGYHLWSEKYDREMQEVFAIQDEITRAIVSALKLRFASTSDLPLVKRQTDDPEAYQLYLKGRELWYQRGVSLMKALHYFELALLQDSNYALAYSGVADTYYLLDLFGYTPPAEAVPKARAAAEKALKIEPTLAEAQLSCAAYQGFLNWDFANAEKAFARAIELNPNYSQAYLWHAGQLSALGRHEESIAEARRALEIDQLSPYAHTMLGWVSNYAHEYDQAIAALRRALELSSDYVVAHWLLGQVYVAKSLFAEGIAELQRASELSGGAAWVRGYLAHAQGSAGHHAKAVALLGELQDPGKQAYVRAFNVALAQAGLGKNEEALEWLARAYEQRDVWLVWVRSVYAFNHLHSDARFTDIVRRIGFENGARSAS